MSKARTSADLGNNLTNTAANINKTGASAAVSAVYFVSDNLLYPGGQIFNVNGGDTYFYQQGSGEFAISGPSESSLTFKTNNIQRLYIDSSGAVRLLPYLDFSNATQPAFCAQYSGATAATLNNYVRFDTVFFNHGSYYNATNGIFTAPVAGRYFFCFNMLPNNPTTGATYLAVFKNGGATAGPYSIVQHPANTWNTIYCHIMLDLAASDTVGVYVTALPAALHTDVNYAAFSGYLMI